MSFNQEESETPSEFEINLRISEEPTSWYETGKQSLGKGAGRTDLESGTKQLCPDAYR